MVRRSGRTAATTFTTACARQQQNGAANTAQASNDVPFRPPAPSGEVMP
ncbi:hypothetical protein [Actinoplanes sp. NPDC051494]